jgi:hypothetical protein
VPAAVVVPAVVVAARSRAHRTASW